MTAPARPGVASEPVRVNPENYWRDVWHANCPERGPMKHHRHDFITLEDGATLIAFECMGCGAWCYAGLDAQRYVVSRPHPKNPVSEVESPPAPARPVPPSDATPIPLIKSLDEYTDEEKDALVKGNKAAWADVYGWHERSEELRARFKANPADATYSADDVAIALNYVESTRILMHFGLGMAIARFKEWRDRFAGAACAYCQWSFKDQELKAADGVELTDEEIAAGQARITAAIREHVKVCPNHPMRALESQVASLTEERDRLREQLERGAK
jgi:hypothetical protein